LIHAAQIKGAPQSPRQLREQLAGESQRQETASEEARNEFKALVELYARLSCKDVGDLIAGR
jgi:hypothetical protein